MMTRKVCAGRRRSGVRRCRPDRWSGGVVLLVSPPPSRQASSGALDRQGVAAGSCWPGHVGEHPRHRGTLRWGHPQPVGRLDRDLRGHVPASKSAVRRQPGDGVGVARGLVGGTVHGEQFVVFVGGQLFPFRRRPGGGIGLPGVAEGDNIVDLHSIGRLWASPPRADHGGARCCVDLSRFRSRRSPRRMMAEADQHRGWS
jgi:hypothetical protein